MKIIKPLTPLRNSVKVIKYLIFNIVFFLSIFNTSQKLYAQCNHQINLYDSFGDGWNGATVTVTVNGTPVLTNITLASGAGPASFTFTASTGDAIQVLFTAPGSWPSECYFDVLDASSTLLVNDWYPNSSGTWNGTANCIVEMKVPTSGNNSYSVCSGNLYDNGGSAGNYADSWNGYTVINPNVAGNKVQVSGTSSGESCCDYVSIYDGVGTGTLLGTYYMNTAIPLLTSSVASGALTVLFFSDGSVVGAGFDITINCFNPCAVAAGTAAASPSALCPAASGNTTLTLTGEDPAATIQWQVSTNGGATWSNIAGATTDPWIQFINTNSMYQALVTNGCTSTSSSVAVTVGCPPIIQPTSGFSTSSIGCGGSTNFYDSGGSGSSYSANENGLITICPSIAGQYVSVSVNSFDIESNFEYLYVFDGNDGSADIIGIYTGVIGAGAVLTASSANTSGCLSFRFTSDGFTNNAGWNLTVTCTATPAAPYPTSVEDCTGGVVVCGNGALTGGTTGPGFQELPGTWNSCLNFGGNGEIQSNWYIFSPATSGTVGFLISPNPSADYDWTIWGPYSSLQCPAFTNDAPIRCSAASEINSGPNGETGLAAPAVDVLENDLGDGYLQPLSVIAGEIYVMMLDNWDGNNNPFTLSWQLSNGATLDCTPPTLPVTLLNFEAKCENNQTSLFWTTEAEINNNFFVIEKSSADFKFKEIGKVFGAGNSNVTNNYTFIDEEANSQTTYYRLAQVDFDGSVRYHKIVASNCHDYTFEVVNSAIQNNSLNLLITGATNESLTINLFNSTGQLIAKQVKEINTGNNIILINNINISSGIYLLSIIGEQNTFSEKLIAK